MLRYTRRIAAAAASAAVVAAGALAPAAAAEPSAPYGGWGEAQQPGNILVVRGSWSQGFRVKFGDGHWTYTPTWSEVRAECLEYRPRQERRCLRASRLEFQAYAVAKRRLQGGPR